jgi:hypothetical protein
MLIVSPSEANEIADRLPGLGERCYPIGRIEARGPDEPALVFRSA